MSEENKNRCPNCGYVMQNMYVQTMNHEGKRTTKPTGSMCCYKCKIEKPSDEMKIIV